MPSRCSISTAQGTSLAPVLRREFEDLAARPAWQEGEHVAEVGPRFDVVEPAARDEGDEGGVPLDAVVAAAEDPVFPADDFAAELELGEVVVEPQSAVV